VATVRTAPGSTTARVLRRNSWPSPSVKSLSSAEVVATFDACIASSDDDPGSGGLFELLVSVELRELCRLFGSR